LRPVVAIEMASFGAYKLWAADLYQCDACDARVLAGFADNAYATHDEPGFKQALERAEARGAIWF
jgi:hypothetical protein